MKPNSKLHEVHRDSTVYEIGKGVAWLITLIFMLLISVPSILQNYRGLTAKAETEMAPVKSLFQWNREEHSILQHLHQVQGRLDESFYSVQLRQFFQKQLTRHLYAGNSKVFVGYDGWLFYQPDLRALTGFGPLKPEPFSVMKDPELAKLPHPKDVIVRFSQQLKERGIDLLLVPVPLKSMIYPEYIEPRFNKLWVTHPDAPAYYQWLREQGIDVLDLTEDFAEFRSKRRYVFVREPDRKDEEAVKEALAQAKELNESFLKQDTHWTPGAMRVTAEKVAKHIKLHYPQAMETADSVIRAEDGFERQSLGDLVKLLDLKSAETEFAEERVFLRQIQASAIDKNSPIVLLGDSFTNIFDDPSLGFATDRQSIRAGFAQHLSVLLQQPLDVIARNGSGSTAVRREFARRPDNEVKAKKLVIWTIAARDLLLSRTAAAQANIEWSHVEFNSHVSKDVPVAPIIQNDSAAAMATGQIIVEAILTEKSPNQAMEGTPYREALHAAVYQIEKVVEGQLDAKEVIGIQWTFRDRILQNTASFREGKRYRLEIEPWDRQESLHGLNLEDTTSVFDADRWYVKSATELP